MNDDIEYKASELGVARHVKSCIWVCEEELIEGFLLERVDTHPGRPVVVLELSNGQRFELAVREVR